LDRWLEPAINARWWGDTGISNTGTNGTDTNEIGITLLWISLLKTQVRTVNKCATSEGETQRLGVLHGVWALRLTVGSLFRVIH